MQVLLNLPEFNHFEFLLRSINKLFLHLRGLNKLYKYIYIYICVYIGIHTPSWCKCALSGILLQGFSSKEVVFFAYQTIQLLTWKVNKNLILAIQRQKNCILPSRLYGSISNLILHLLLEELLHFVFTYQGIAPKLLWVPVCPLAVSYTCKQIHVPQHLLPVKS